MNFSFEGFEIDNLLAAAFKYVILPTYTNLYKNQFCVCQKLCKFRGMKRWYILSGNKETNNW